MMGMYHCEAKGTHRNVGQAEGDGGKMGTGVSLMLAGSPPATVLRQHSPPSLAGPRAAW